MPSWLYNHSLTLAFGTATVVAQVCWVIGHVQHWHAPTGPMQLAIVGTGEWAPELGVSCLYVLSRKYLKESGSPESSK